MSQIDAEIWEQQLQLTTDPRLFSPRQADAGTMAMLAQIQLKPDDRVLDLGCGYGLVGLAAAKALSPGQVVLVDIDPLAVDLARINARQNGCPDVKIVTGDGPMAVAPDHFSLILCNPPYHTDFAVARRLIEQSWPLLDNGGRLVMVVKRLTWYQKKLTGVFGGVRVKPVQGYYVLSAEKRPRSARVSSTPSGRLAGSPAGLDPGGTTRKHRKKILQAESGKKHRPPNETPAKSPADTKQD